MNLETISIKQDRNLFMIVLIIGILTNFIVISANGYLMPVKSGYHFETNIHMGYDKIDEVKFWQLSDIIGFNTKKSMIRWSIGDMIIILALLGLGITNFKLIRKSQNTMKVKDG